MNIFVERLNQAVEEAGLKQNVLADRTGISKAAVSQYLSGKNTPSEERVKALAEATGVTVDFLLGRDIPPERERRTPVKKITTAEAARCLGKSSQFIRLGLQSGRLPFGTAVLGNEGTWNYHISPAKFRDYIGEEAFNEFFGLTA